MRLKCWPKCFICTARCRGEREFPFPTIPGNTSLPFPFPKVGNGFFIPIPVPKSWEYNCSFPFPKVGNAILHSRSFHGNESLRSGIRSGMNYQSWDYDSGVSGNDFWAFGNGNGNGSVHSQLLGTGTGMKNSIPNFWEWEREWKLHSQFLGMGPGMKNSIPDFRERE